ncbi:flagellar hook-associated protein FlgL [Lysinibacillus piscis]|uniref:Flagellar hook-associated protein 3 n=1 Tax=Lysinibacillus piscis TaxID=2518931 RepID=A0ABQ5NIB7_9BACI|nr:flagellar hook-associated protein FlgL [Lysinibacillus sp. KH24]GLC87832.1 flagellar hook-associated protein 3 [Lysinibacillus sp. KH24]
MRVTQSMLSSNMLRNLNTSYNKMSKYQNMLDSGSKITRPSDDPVVAVKGMGYRVDIDKNVQYQRNIREAHTWLDTTDEAFDQVGSALKRVKELIVQAANDSNTPEDRQKINAEMEQIREQLRDIANTKVGENYIFSGTHTNEPLYLAGGAPNPAITSGGGKPIEINVFDGIAMNINTPGTTLFADIDNFMAQTNTLLQSGGTSATISAKLSDLDVVNESTLTARADVGARQNRVEMMENRLGMQEVNVTKQLSLNEDTDYAKTITEMVTQESIHQAALSVGAKIIQQTLVDFIR